MAIELNPFAQQAIRNIKAGDTAYQRARDLKRRALVGGAQALLQGGAGLLHWAQDKADTRNAREASQAKSGKDIKAAVDSINAQDQASQWMPTPEPTEQLRNGAKDRLASIDNADNGVALPYGDVWNRRAFDDTYDEASLLGHDINVGESLLKKQSPSDWDASGAAVGGPVPTEQALGEMRGRRGLGGSLSTWGK